LRINQGDIPAALAAVERILLLFPTVTPAEPSAIEAFFISNFDVGPKPVTTWRFIRNGPNGWRSGLNSGFIAENK
jgi:hypothetical protein